MRRTIKPKIVFRPQQQLGYDGGVSVVTVVLVGVVPSSGDMARQQSRAMGGEGCAPRCAVVFQREKPGCFSGRRDDVQAAPSRVAKAAQRRAISARAASTLP